MIYVNETESRTTFKIKTGYYLELLTPESIKLLASTKSKINKDENGEKVPHLEITEVIHCNVVNNVISKIQGSCIYLFLINQLVNY